MTEACLAGMSIMDTYFDKLNPKDIKRSDSLGTHYDEDEDEEEATGDEKSDELVIYEAKDPYVLRSLPYLIGSQAFLDHDHVGLKDLDSDDEDLFKEDSDDDNEDDSETENEKNATDSNVFDDSKDEDKMSEKNLDVNNTIEKNSKSVFAGSDSEDSDSKDLFRSSRTVSGILIAKREIYFCFFYFSKFFMFLF